MDYLHFGSIEFLAITGFFFIIGALSSYLVVGAYYILKPRFKPSPAGPPALRPWPPPPGDPKD